MHVVFAAFLIFVFFGIPTLKASSELIKFRSDLNFPQFNRFICKNPDKIDSYSYLQEGFEDAGLKLLYIKTESQSKRTLNKAAKEWSRRNHDFGYYYYRCTKKYVTLVSTPSAVAMNSIFRDPEGLFRLSKKYCHSIKALWAPNEISFVSNIKLLKLKHFKQMKNGTLSLICQPLSPSWIGPKVWYNLNSSSNIFVPLSEHKDLSILDWINSIRKKLGLKRVVHAPAKLGFATKKLSKSTSVNHNHRLLSQITTHLLQREIKLLGEIRISSKNAAMSKMLLWRSPSHRSLILSPKARYMDFAVKKVQKNHFNLIIMAE